MTTELDAILFPPPKRAELFGGRVPVRPATVVINEALPREGFLLRCDDLGVAIRAGSDAAVGYARMALEQLRGGATDVPACEIEDWPDFATRGVTIDVSRDKVPTLPTLFSLIDRLHRWRYNHVEFYIEHTFAYRGHEEVWRDASPYSGDDLALLIAYCGERAIEFTVQQNCLGHMERWLSHPRYEALAATPGGYRDDRGNVEPAATLDPTSDDAFALVTDLLEQLDAALPPRRRIHIGLDEPLDLNPELWAHIFSEDVLDSDNDGIVVELPAHRQAQYTRWLARIRSLPFLADRELLMWADVASANPAVLAAIPAGVTLVEWGYEPGHPWDERCARFVERGQPFLVCPGTSSWSALAGHPDQARQNLEEAALAGLRHGAGGYLVADWGDGGHHQFPETAEAVWALGGAYAWNAEAARGLDWASVIDRQVFDDSGSTIGQLLIDLGSRSSLLIDTPVQACLLTAMLSGQDVVDRVVAAGLGTHRVALVEGLLVSDRRRLHEVRSMRPDSELVIAELRLTIGWFLHACARARATLTGLPGRLDVEFGALLQEQSRLWLLRNAPGGLADSLSTIAPPQKALP